MKKIQIPHRNMDADPKISESVQRNIEYIADNVMPARRETERGAPQGGVDGDESWRLVDGKLFLYRRHRGSWYRTEMEEV